MRKKKRRKREGRRRGTGREEEEEKDWQMQEGEVEMKKTGGGLRKSIICRRTERSRGRKRGEGTAAC